MKKILISAFIIFLLILPNTGWAKVTGWTEAEMQLLFDALDTSGTGVLADDWWVNANALVLNKLDATAAPDADNDVDEGYAPGSIWVDVTNDNFYICVDATDGAAVWSSGGGSGSGTSISQGDTGVYATDTGTDGKVEVKADNETFMEVTADGIAMGIIATDSSLTVHQSYDPQNASTWNAGETVDIGDILYYDGTAGEMMLADADVTTEYPAFGICLGATTGLDSEAADGEPILVMREGVYVDTSWDWDPGEEICLSEIAGGVIACDDASIFSAEDDAKQIIGFAITADSVYFDFHLPHIVKGP